MKNKTLYTLLSIVILLAVAYYTFVSIRNNPLMTNETPATSTDVVMVPETPATSTPAAPEESSHPLLGKRWAWVRSTDPLVSSTTTIKAPEDKFIISFGTDKRFTSSTDCNGLSGGFIIDGEVLSVGPIASTKMACPGGTLEMTYAAELGRVASYVIVGEELRLNLIKDTGTMIFKRMN